VLGGLALACQGSSGSATSGSTTSGAGKPGSGSAGSENGPKVCEDCADAATPGCGDDCVPKEKVPLLLQFDEIALPKNVDYITDFAFIPGTMQALVTTKDGRVVHLDVRDDTTKKLGEFQLDDVYDVEDCGLISLALDPDFDQNGFVYLGYCTSIRASGVYRVQFGDDYGAIPDTLTEIVSVAADPVKADRERPWHNVGAINFGPKKELWVAFGEKTRYTPASDPTNDLGSLLRIVPNRDPNGSGFTPAPDNPFIGSDKNSEAIYAYGLRSPWRGAIDHLGRYFIGDVGSNVAEEIDMVDAPGLNFGWPDSEGPCEKDCEGVVDPIVSYDRETDNPYILDDPDVNPLGQRVVQVGVEYEDQGNDRYDSRLQHRLIYGEFCAGWIRALKVSAAGAVVEDKYIGHMNHLSAWRQGEDGYLYATTYGRCQTNDEHPSDQPSRFFRAVASDD
jgi:glucose/arabinose dehydrogenase